MPQLRRKPGFNEYVDIRGILRASKGKYSLLDSNKLQADKQMRFEKKITRKDVIPVLRKPPHEGIWGIRQSPQIKRIPCYDIYFRNRYIGFIQRGHRLVIRFRKKGVFLKALKQIEKDEIELFSNSRFPTYKKLILTQMEKEKKATTTSTE